MNISCPSCSQDIEISEEHAGTVGTCPTCQCEMALPDLSEFQIAESSVPQSEHQLPPAPVLTSQSKAPPAGSAAEAILRRSKRPKPGFFSLLFSFSGRLPRSFFWAIRIGGIVFVLVVVGIVGSVLTVNAKHIDAEKAANIQLYSTLGVLTVFLVVCLSCNVRRWHDRNKSGFWVFISFIPVIGGLWQFIETGFLPGTDGPNQYGEKP